MYLFHAKNAQSNTQVLLKVSDIGLGITDQLIGVLLKGNKYHFTLNLTMTNIMV